MFSDQFDLVEVEIPFDPKWDIDLGRVGAGCFDNLISLLKLEDGEEVKSTCPVTGRKLIMIGTKYGTMVFFQRYGNRSDTIAHDGPQNNNLMFVLGDLSLTEKRFLSRMGKIGDNYDTSKIFLETSTKVNIMAKLEAILTS